MKKIALALFIIVAGTAINAQNKKPAKKFVETVQFNINSADSNLQSQMNTYYLETKNMILDKQTKLGDDKVNELLIFNQKEYYKATKNKLFNSTNMSRNDAKIANDVFKGSLSSNLENYRLIVLDKLDSYLAKS